MAQIPAAVKHEPTAHLTKKGPVYLQPTIAAPQVGKKHPITLVNSVIS